MYQLMEFEAEEGTLLQGGNRGKIVIGYNLKDGNSNGFGRDIEVGKKVLINGEKFTVVGILERQGSFILDNVILIYDEDLDDLVGYGDNVDIIAALVKDQDLMDRAKVDIEKLLRNRRDVKVGEEDFEVSTPDAALDQVNSVINGIQIFVVLIAFISIIVGGIGIVNTMATAVIERKEEIGIMKAIGARNKHIFMLFFVESGFLGLVGGMIGIIVGLLIGYAGTLGINNFVGAEASPMISIPLIIFSLLGSFFVGAVAGIVPAMNAARQSPVEALRG
jgi:putative ABC transport system permease protein